MTAASMPGLGDLASLLAFEDERATGSRLALRLRIGPSPTPRDVTFADLRGIVASAASSFDAIGCRPGQRVALLLPQSERLVSTFLGGLHAGLVPTILPWPTAKMDAQKYRRNLTAVVAGLGADWLVAEEATVRELGAALGRTRVVDPASLAGGHDAFPARPRREGTAFIQYSGGTTGTQKSVPVSFEALRCQLEAYAVALGLTHGDHVISWLPLYHDMGLVAALLIPFFFRLPVSLFGPMEWVTDPRPFLGAVARDRATLCWLPNFAFAFQALRAQATPAGSLDLSSLRAVVNCSEPVRPDSMDRFLARFRGHGLRPEALHACYAMAETTFAVTQTTADDPPRRSEAFPRVVSSGRPIPGMEVRVVDGAGRDREPGGVGEICVRGGSVMTGYLDSPPEAARTAFSDGWYHTGDQGAMIDGHLYVTGRRKDLVIAGGVNVYPEDVEAAVGEVDGIHAGRVAAFGLEDVELGTERLVVVAEVAAAAELARTNVIERDVRRTVHGTTGVAPHEVVIVEPRWIVKSTAGKIARAETRAKLLASRGKGETATVQRLVHDRLRRPQAVGDDTPLVSGGLLDSMSLVDLILDLESALGVRLPPSDVQPEDFDSINRIVATLSRYR